MLGRLSDAKHRVRLGGRAHPHALDNVSERLTVSIGLCLRCGNLLLHLALVIDNCLVREHDR